MDPRYCAQDVVRCTMCQTAEGPVYCEVCHIYLCDECVVKHLADKSQVHKVVPLKQFLSTPKCPDHPNKQCELHCAQCDVPICSQCVITKKHNNHDIWGLIENYKQKQKLIRRDLEELEKSIFPECQKAAENITAQKESEQRNSLNLKTAINKHGEALHKEINIIINDLKSEIDDYDAQNQAAIRKQEIIINSKLGEIKQVIQDLRSLLDTSDVCLVSKYKSRNKEFKTFPPKHNVTLPSFQPREINREQLLRQFVGSLSPLSIESEEQDYSLQSPGTESSSPNRQLLDIPRIITELATGSKLLQGVSCLSDEEIWTRGDDEIMRLYKLKGELVKTVQTKSWNMPADIAVIRNGDLVYTDTGERSINRVKNKTIQRLIKLSGWIPLGVCSTASGDFLVIMDSKDKKQSKVLRYSGSTEKQSIQWDDQGKPLFSSGYNKYLSENKNSDICVADYGARVVVVVSAAGKLRFRCNGPFSGTERSFKPYGITTDSQGHILISDCLRVHVLDQDGHFLRYIDNCGLRSPFGLCVDSRDNLFVAENNTGKENPVLHINTQLNRLCVHSEHIYYKIHFYKK